MDALTATGWAAGWLAIGRTRQLPARLPAEPAPASVVVSVVVPARNEATRLPRLLAALGSEPVPGRADEIIVVDDGSTDGTAALASRAGATVIHADPPTGWTGKSWACWQGAKAARGDVVVFLDADVEPVPGFVTRLAAAAAASQGMVSVQPTHRVEACYEQSSAVCSTVALMAGTGTTRPSHRGYRWWRRPVAFGPALAVPRARYLEAGGHGQVASSLVEDMALAQALDRAGVPVAAYADGGQGDLRYRMYPEGPRTLVEGWTKNLAAGAGHIPPVRAALVALWVTGGLRAALVAPNRPGTYALYVAQAAVLFRRAGNFHPVAALAYPWPLSAFVVLAARSAAARVSGSPVRWRDRMVPQ
jgi:4,4'-diaponeurosporenoate glycosyltransferase